MKKFIFILSTMLLGSFSLTSCGDDDSSDTKVMLEQALNYLSSLYADGFDGKGFSGESLGDEIRNIDFGAGNKVHGMIDESLAKNFGSGSSLHIIRLGYGVNLVYFVADYTVSGNKYSIAGGEMVFELKDNTEGKGRAVTITLKDGRKREGTTNIKKAPANPTQNITYACGDWQVVSTSFVYRDYKEDGNTVKSTYSYNFPHGDLNKMADKLLEDHGIDLRDDIAKKGGIKGISFQGYSRWSIDFTEGSPSCGDWWINGVTSNGFKFGYKWDDEKDMSFSFEGGDGELSFAGYNASLLLKGSGTTNGGDPYKLQVTLTLSRK